MAPVFALTCLFFVLCAGALPLTPYNSTNKTVQIPSIFYRDRLASQVALPPTLYGLLSGVKLSRVNDYTGNILLMTVPYGMFYFISWSL